MNPAVGGRAGADMMDPGGESDDSTGAPGAPTLAVKRVFTLGRCDGTHGRTVPGAVPER